MITSEWGTPNMTEAGLDPAKLMGSEYGHRLHLWDLRKRCHLQALDLGAQHQIVLELRPAHNPHNPNRTYGFVNAVVNLEDLSSSIWLWYHENSRWSIRKFIDIPAEPADPEMLPPALKDFDAVPPLVSGIVLSLDDRFLYVSCWGPARCVSTTSPTRSTPGRQARSTWEASSARRHTRRPANP